MCTGEAFCPRSNPLSNLCSKSKYVCTRNSAPFVPSIISGCQVGLRRSDDCSKGKYFRTSKASIFVQIAKGKRKGTYSSAGGKGGKGGAASSPDFDDADMKDLENFFKNDPVFQVAS